MDSVLPIKYLFPEGSLATADLGIPTLAVTAMPPWAAGLVLARCVRRGSVFCRWIWLISLAGTFVSDIYSKLINPNAKPETVKKLNMCSIIVVAIIVFLFACDPPELLASLITYASGGMTVAFFHVLLLGLFWKPANEYGAVAGIISGIALFLLIDKGILPLSLGMNAAVMATLLSTIIMVARFAGNAKNAIWHHCHLVRKDYPEQ